MKANKFILLRSVLPVVAQFVLILLLALPFPHIEEFLYAALLPLSCGAGLGLWTLYHNRVGNFNVRPDPKVGGILITSGPYRHIRHPMYTSVLLIMAAFVFCADDPLKIFYWLLLLTVLWIKSSIEEDMLAQKFPDYAAYRKTAGRFLPRLYVRRNTA